ncbi:uncharacterized protein LOC109609645 isoform X2 [Aethina tumida]|uniref:uncharacterized protein LOC109609645 isoform X2 n=1 Tax=Aethina tumida TaxID=116153 RepID=UPI00096AF720|nr:uncharacterized protein LOC109609645 isoform X2 [Aethina tumida]
MPKLMDNKGYISDKGTELKKVVINGTQTQTEEPGPSKPITCTPDVCRQARQRFQPPDLADSPWHTKKTYFFFGIIVLLVIWAIIYGLLTHFDVV